MTVLSKTAVPARSTDAAGTRREGAYDLILSAIIFGDLPPGSAVDEKMLVDQFRIGLAGVRDALYRLSLEGLVERQPRMGQGFRLSVRELHDVFEARVLLEGARAALAAARASADDIATMRAAFAGYEDAIGQREYRKPSEWTRCSTAPWPRPAATS